RNCRLPIADCRIEFTIGNRQSEIGNGCSADSICKIRVRSLILRPFYSDSCFELSKGGRVCAHDPCAGFFSPPLLFRFLQSLARKLAAPGSPMSAQRAETGATRLIGRAE